MNQSQNDQLARIKAYESQVDYYKRKLSACHSQIKELTSRLSNAERHNNKLMTQIHQSSGKSKVIY